MSLSDLGNLGELVGGIAVIVTLIYLVIQVRQNSAATRAKNRQALANDQIRYINGRATDPFLRRTVEQMFAGEEIAREDRFGLRMHVIAGLRMFENYFAQFENGTMDREDWRAMREIVKLHFAFAQYRETFELMRSAWNAAFAREIAAIIAEIDGSPGPSV